MKLMTPDPRQLVESQVYAHFQKLVDALPVAGGRAAAGKGGPSNTAGGPIQIPQRPQFVVTCPPAATGDVGRKR